MANKLTNCKVCGAEMAASAKVCPSCGAKNKKPVFRRWWFWALIVVVIIGIIAGSSGGSKSSAAPSDTSTDSQPQEEEEITYTHYNVTDLFDALADNAMKAQDTYKGQYVEIEGYLGTIDSNGKYIAVEADPENYDYMFQDIQCYIQNDEQRSQIMELSSGSPITVRGKITDVGEVLGYYLDIDSIN